MSSVDYLARTGIVSVSWNRTDNEAAGLPKKSIHPLGSVQPSYIKRIFKTHHSEAQIVDTLAFRVSDESILTPGNYQGILEQLRTIAAETEADENHGGAITRACHFLDELADNVTLLNLNRQIQTSS